MDEYCNNHGELGERSCMYLLTRGDT